MTVHDDDFDIFPKVDSSEVAPSPQVDAIDVEGIFDGITPSKEEAWAKLIELVKLLVVKDRQRDEKDKIRDRQIATLTSGIKGLRSLFQYDPEILVGEAPIEPVLQEYSSKCTKCDQKGFILNADNQATKCECREKYDADHGAWKKLYDRWASHQGTAARRKFKDLRDTARLNKLTK